MFATEKLSSQALRAKYAVTGRLYDVLDAPLERVYQRWRPVVVREMQGKVLEAGVGTGHNLIHYREEANVLGVDVSPAMLEQAKEKASQAVAHVELQEGDITNLSHLSDASFDWVCATFLFTVLPTHQAHAALREMARLLKPGGRFRFLEMTRARHERLARWQGRVTPMTDLVYGARFDRPFRPLIRYSPGLELERSYRAGDGSTFGEVTRLDMLGPLGDMYELLEGQRSPH